MEQSRRQSSNRAADDRRRRDQQERRSREHAAAAGERRAEPAVERCEPFDQDIQLRRAQARVARQQVAQPVGQLALQQDNAVRTIGQLAIRATEQPPSQQP